MNKPVLISGLVLAALGVALVPLPGPGYPVLAVGLLLVAAALVSAQLGSRKRT